MVSKTARNGHAVTSIILATIMVAGGVTFAIPGAIPEAAAQSSNANLYVSAENADTNNAISGLNVVEVVVRDPERTIRSGSDIAAEPRVTVDGDLLRMVHGNDGNWYGYFAEANIMKIDDGNSSTPDAIDYGNTDATCSVERDGDVYIIAPGNDIKTEADDVYCANGANDHPVVRTVKNPNTATDNPNMIGTIGIAANLWPFIQVYDFDDESDVVVEYEKGGDAQSVTLYYDSDPSDYGVGLELGRDRYPLGSGIIITMTDFAMDVDPTDSDTWTFMTTDNSTHVNYQDAYYYLFDDDGACIDANRGQPPIDRDGPDNKGLEGVEDNLYLTIDTDKDGSIAVEFKPEHDGNQMIRDSDGDPVCTLTDSRGASLIQNAVDENNRIVTFIEGDSGVFTNTDSDSDTPNLIVPTGAKRGTTAVIDYNDGTMSVVVGNSFATITLDDDAVGGVWNSGEEMPVTLTDPDVNRMGMNDEDIDVSDSVFTIIPSVRIGSPITLDGDNSMVMVSNGENLTLAPMDMAKAGNYTMDAFSDIARLMPSMGTNDVDLTFKAVVKSDNLKSFLMDDPTYRRTVNGLTADTPPATFQFINFDTRSIGDLQSAEFQWAYPNKTAGDPIPITGVSGSQGLVDITSVDVSMIPDDTPVDIMLSFANTASISAGETYPIVVDLFSFGQVGDGVAAGERINNAIYRLELEESGDNTGVFEGTIEFVMLNQINVRNPDTYAGIVPISDEIVMIVHNDLTDEDSVRVNYRDLGADGVYTQIADQVEAPTTSGSVSFDADNYKVADTVTVTLEDADLNTAVDTIDIYTVVGNAPYKKTEGANPVDRVLPMFDDDYNSQKSIRVTQGPAFDMVGVDGYGFNTAGDAFGRVLDITFDDQLWLKGCEANMADDIDNGLGETGFTLIETGADTGVFTGDFQIPLQYCHRLPNNAVEARSTTGVDMEVNYVDYRDASGETLEVGDSAGIRANTGTVSLDRTVYPVPFGVPGDFDSQNLQGASIFPIHATGIKNILQTGNFIANGDLTIHIRVNDPDFDVSASGEDSIAVNIPRGTQNAQTPVDELEHGPLKVTVSRGAASVIVATAGGEAPNDGRITTLGTQTFVRNNQIVQDVLNDVRVYDKKLAERERDPVPRAMQPITREVGPITEIAPDAGIFELDLTLRYTDGPAGSQCPTTSVFGGLGNRDNGAAEMRFTDDVPTHCIQQGDILTVEYTDPTDSSGNPNTVTDSATFDLRNGVLQSDKSVYIIGQDMILTLIEPDLDLESDEAETYDLDLIEWDSDAAGTTMGNMGGGAVFDPEPSDLRETGDSTGIFQVVVEIPEAFGNNRVERGEEIELEYTDFGPSGADYVGDDTEDINLTVFTSNFGATIELDQKVYTWTDKVYITIVAPDHNFDSDLVDEIGETSSDPIRVSTRSAELEQYRLVETGTDTGIFAGEVILTGFSHDADGDTTTGNNGYDIVNTPASGTGPTDGKLPTGDDDGITVSFEFSEDETVVTTALVRWSIGEVQWLETSYPAQGTGIVRVIDPDMNLDPESVDNFGIDVYSDSDSGGIDLTVTETNEATGVFEGTVFFTTTDESSGHRLRVAEGDTITAEYTDGTLPNPYSTNDDIDVTAAAIIGTIVPPLERAPVSNARVVDSFGNTLSSVSVDQQVQITADVINGQDRTQSFAYLVQIQDANGVTVSLSWIEGSLNPGQSLSPAQSWTPDMPGSYTATVFVWESVDNPTALSPPGTVTVNVR